MKTAPVGISPGISSGPGTPAGETERYMEIADNSTLPALVSAATCTGWRGLCAAERGPRLSWLVQSKAQAHP
jgi:hypothetical protein